MTGSDYQGSRSLAMRADLVASLSRRKLANMNGVKTNRRQGIGRYSARQPLRGQLRRQIEIKLGRVKPDAAQELLWRDRIRAETSA
jgi:hypothetical protein